MSKGKVLSRTLQAAGIHDGIKIRKGDWELELERRIPGAPKDKKKPGLGKFQASENEMLSMAKEKAQGKTNRQIGDKYGFAATYVEAALRKLYVNNEKGREILKGVLLEGAIATGMRVQEKIRDLTAAQSVIATTALTAKFIDLDKHNSEQRKNIDYDELTGLGDDLRKLREAVGEDNDDEPSVIDIEADVLKNPKKKKKMKQLRLQ